MLYMKIFLKVTPTISKFYGNCFQKKQKLAAIKNGYTKIVVRYKSHNYLWRVVSKIIETMKTACFANSRSALFHLQRISPVCEFYPIRSCLLLGRSVSFFPRKIIVVQKAICRKLMLLPP